MQRKTEGYRERGRAIAVIAVTSALAAAAMLAQGCGHENDANSQAAIVTPAVTPETTPSTAPVMTSAEAVKPMVATGRGPQAGDGALPPDVQVAVADTLVTPGEPVTIVVRATSDATRIELKTETGDVLPMVKDEGSRSWRVTYRVPLEPVHERWGVSITARNDSNRWRRVWVFMHARDGSDAEGDVAGPDSSRTLVK